MKRVVYYATNGEAEKVFFSKSDAVSYASTKSRENTNDFANSWYNNTHSEKCGRSETWDVIRATANGTAAAFRNVAETGEAGDEELLDIRRTCRIVYTCVATGGYLVKEVKRFRR